MVSIPACHAGDRDSITRRGDFWILIFWISIFWILTFKNFSVALAKRSRFFSWCILFYFSTIFTILMKIKCFSIFSRQYWTINLTLLSHPWGMKKWLVYRGWPVYRTKIVLIVSIGDWKSYPLTPLCIASPRIYSYL